MSIQVRMQEDLKQAMRARDVLRRSVLRYLRSEIHNAEIAQQKELDDEGVLAVLSRQAQQRRDSIEAYEGANRQDLVEREKGELSIILEYLPQQLTRAEIDSLVEQAIAETGASGPADMGKVMGKLMPQVRGRAEGRDVSAAASAALGRLAG
jgi:uncharacterized protein YqeY